MATKRLREVSRSSEHHPSLEMESHTPKYAEVDDSEQLDTRPKMQCSLPPHKTMTFTNYSQYETHYQTSHTNRCKECGHNLPSAHFLELHLAENHDPIVATKRDKGDKTFTCFVEGCDKVCMDWKKRRSHLVDKHGFPKNYDFFIVNNGIDGKRSMLRPGIDQHGHRQSSRERRGSSAKTETTQTTDATSVSQPAVSEPSQSSEAMDSETQVKSKQPASKQPGTGEADTSMDDITKSMSSLQFVPRSVTFGRRKGKSGFAKS